MDGIPDSQVTVDEPVAPAAGTQAGVPDHAVVPDPVAVSGQPANVSDDDVQLDSDKYGGVGQQIKAGLEGVAAGIAGPLATAAEVHGFDVPPEDILGRREANPWTHGIGEAVGLAASSLVGVGEGALLAKAGAGAAKLAGLGEAASVGEKLARGAVTAAAEMGLFQAGDEATKALIDPTQTLGNAAINVGLSSAIGGATGPLFTGAGMAFKKAFNATDLKDFVEETAKLRSDVSPADAAGHEFTNAINTYDKMGKAINGAEGLKAAAIHKLLPKELTPAIDKQTQVISNKVDAALKAMKAKDVPARMLRDFESDANKMLEVVTNPGSSPSQYFDALNEFRGDLWANSKGNFGVFEIPKYHEAYNFLNITKSLANDVKTALQDSGVWGKAADIQKDINKSWHGIIDLVDQTKPKFMTKIGNDFEFSNDKWQTYFNKAGKATTATDKQKMLGQFIEKLSSHFDAVDNIYSAAGVANPFPSPGMPTLKESLNIPSYGTKLARTYARVMPDMAGTGAAVSIGESLSPGFGGAFVGEKVLGPIFRALSRSTMEHYPNVDYNYFNRAYSLLDGIQKGNNALYNGTRELFKGGAKVLPSKLVPSKDDIKDLDEKIKAMSDDLDAQSSSSGGAEHYLPNHAMAMSQGVSKAITYLNAQRPVMIKAMPFDSEPEASSMQKTQFARVLSAAQQPLTVLQHIKDGTIIPQDVLTLHSIYPDLYTKMSQELLTAATEHVGEGGHIPYHVKQSLSLFLGQAIDSTMTPFAIQSAQGVFAAKAAAQAAPQQGMAKKSSRKNTIADNYATADESSQKRKHANS